MGNISQQNLTPFIAQQRSLNAYKFEEVVEYLVALALPD